MPEMPESSPPTRTEPLVPSVSVLLVDDKPANLLALRAILEDLGQNLVEARSGEEALAFVESSEFAVILLDVWMPGMDGFETARRIRENAHSRHTPIIFLTADEIEPSQIEEGYLLGAVDFLTKPLSRIALHAKVREFIDLSQEKLRARREAEQLRLLVQGTTEYAIFMLDPEGYVQTWNSGAERLKGYRAEEIIGQHFSRFYPAEALARKWPEHELTVARRVGRFEDEGWRLRKDGTRFWANVVITALTDEKGELRGFSKVTRDSTARRQAEEALRHSEERFRVLVESVKDYAIFLLDPEGRVASWNAGAERIKQYRAEDIIGQHFSNFYGQEDIDRGWPEHELRVAKQEGRFEDEGWRIRKDGSRFWANVVITALRDDAGNLRGFSKITRDMTDRKRSEEDARRLVAESTARRVAEENAQAIQEQRERLHVTLASIGDAVVSTDAKGRIDFLNPVAQRLLGWNSQEIRGRPLREVFHIVNEKTRQLVENPAQRALEEGVIVGLANGTILIARDHREIPIDDCAAPIRDAAGNVVGSVLVFRDISDRKRGQEALRESEERFRGLMEQAPFSIQIFSPDGRTKRVNRAWEELWNATWEQIADYNILNDRQLEAKGVLPYIRRAFSGEAVSVPAVLYDPSEAIAGRQYDPAGLRWVSAVAYPLKDDAGHLQEVVLVHQDITSRKRAEEERERFAFLVENSRDFIGMSDLELVPFFVNREGLRLVGLDSFEQLQKFSVSDFFFPEDRPFMAEQFFPQVLREGYGEVEIRFRHFQTGQPIWFAYSVVTIRDSEGKPSGFATISRDISRLKEMNLALRQSDRRKDEFLALLAHELRNPLAPLRNGLQIMRLAEGDPATLGQTREIMERQLTHMVRLIDDLLDVSRINRNKMELRRSRLLLADVVNSAVETARPLIDEAAHRLIVALPDEPIH
jgi:PAS domain S-box-containing protein